MVLRGPHLKAILNRHFGKFASMAQIDAAVREILKLSDDWFEVSLKDIPAEPPLGNDCMLQCELARIFYTGETLRVFQHRGQM